MIKTVKNSGVTVVIDNDRFNKRIRVIRYEGAIQEALADIMTATEEEGAEKIIVYTKQR